MIPVTVQTPDASYTFDVQSWQSLKTISELAECPGPKEKGYGVSYSINGTDYIFSPALPGAIRFILEVYQDGGFT